MAPSVETSTKVILKPHENAALGNLENRIDVVCTDCQAIIIGKLPSTRAAYFATKIAAHRCK
jgi:hypothetical protein